MAGRVHAWHLSRFAAHKGAACLAAAFRNARDDALRDAGLKFAAGEIVEKKQRLGALSQDIIGAHGDKIDTDRIVNARVEGEHQFCADAIRAGHKDGILPVFLLQVEQGAEAAKTAHDTGAPRRLGHWRDRFDQSLACLNIDTGILVGKGSFIF